MPLVTDKKLACTVRTDMNKTLEYLGEIFCYIYFAGAKYLEISPVHQHRDVTFLFMFVSHNETGTSYAKNVWLFHL